VRSSHHYGRRSPLGEGAKAVYRKVRAQAWIRNMVESPCAVHRRLGAVLILQEVAWTVDPSKEGRVREAMLRETHPKKPGRPSIAERERRRSARRADLLEIVALEKQPPPTRFAEALAETRARVWDLAHPAASGTVQAGGGSMAKETKVVTLNVRGIGEDADVAGACLAKIVKAGKGKKIVSCEVGQHVVFVKSEHESTEELAAWASTLESELRDHVSGTRRMVQPTLPRSAEG
jgi:hypothetical protein